MNRFKFMVRLTGPEWVKFRNEHLYLDKNGVMHVPTGWTERHVRVVTLQNMDVHEIEYDGPLTRQAFELLELVVEYVVLGEGDPLGS